MRLSVFPECAYPIEGRDILIFLINQTIIKKRKKRKGTANKTSTARQFRELDDEAQEAKDQSLLHFPKGDSRQTIQLALSIHNRIV
jgi:hypothetical protein